MYLTPTQILEAASTIRAHLLQLVGSERTPELDRQLSDYLNQSDLNETQKATQLRELLDSNPETKTWLDQFLDDPPSTRSYESLPGKPSLPPAQKYTCPVGNDYTKYLETTEEPPLCPTHLVKLVEA